MSTYNHRSKYNVLAVLVSSGVIGCSSLLPSPKKPLDVSGLHRRFQQAVVDDEVLNRLYAHSKMIEEGVTVGQTDVTRNSGEGGSITDYYLAHHRNQVVPDAYNSFLFSMTEYSGANPTMPLPPHI